ncbi:MAG: hypothetical protein NVS1B7_0540 [Candidatus Saccharimonadales bacterium]
MKVNTLDTSNPSIRLIEPNVTRDAQLGLEWLNGELGRTTMMLMGNSETVIDNTLPTTLQREEERVKQFIERDDQLNWMIEYEGKIVGSAWADIKESDDLPAPSVHIMIGDPAMRGKGVGYTTISAILKYLEEQGNRNIYSRHIISNESADQLLNLLGFEDLNSPYFRDGVEYQNLVRKTSK